MSAVFNQRVMLHVDELFEAQFTLATGSIKIFRVDEVGKDKKRVHSEVIDSDKIKQVLDETDGDGGTTIDNTYYFVSHIQPDNRAIDSLLNRGLGKPKDSLDVVSNGKEIKLVTFQIAGAGINKESGE